jgi:hypothetical protein
VIGIPGTINDLVWWFQVDKIKGTNTVSVPWLGNLNPAVPGTWAGLATGTVTVDSAQLNGLNVLKWPAATTGRYVMATPVQFSAQVTVFAVVKPSAATNQTLIGAANSGLQVDVNSGANGFDLTKAQIGVIASSSVAMTAGTWYQINATWSATTGVYAFRVARATAGSGTSTLTTITAVTSGVGYNVATSGSDLSSSVAEVIVYDRILTATEISIVENYLFNKWAV